MCVFVRVLMVCLFVCVCVGEECHVHTFSLNSSLQIHDSKEEKELSLCALKFDLLHLLNKKELR